MEEKDIGVIVKEEKEPFSEEQRQLQWLDVLCLIVGGNIAQDLYNSINLEKVEIKLNF